ncbi:MAG: hypothetical protein KatS3mg115_0195 [Candidatus Poribacteria bacterium]|nr:MAG: hypothetical protein KatS3mg115_0195 [Candidatus Poribacteria bacterium]
MEVRLPPLGEGADSGTVVNILVQVGDRVEKDQVVLELENEKAVAPIPAPASGVVTAVHVEVGQEVSVGDLILSLQVEGEEAAAPSEAPAEVPAARPEAPAPAAPAQPAAPADSGVLGSYQYRSPSGSPPPAAPSVRKLAAQLGIDLTRVPGSGRGGRIVLEDLRRYIQWLQSLAFGQAPAPAPTPTAAERPTPQRIDFERWGPVRRERLSSLRRTIARRLQEAWNAIPHVTQFDEADITELMALRGRYKELYEQRGARLTLTPFAVKAVVAALQEFPIFNASLDEATQEVVFKEHYHIGIAVDTEHGLYVPVVRDADKKSLLEIAQEIEALAEKARARRLSAEEMEGGTFTISNQGALGGGHFTPIVNPPQAAILGIGRGGYRPVVRNGEIVPRLMMPLAVSYDHRLIDGGAAARFIVRLVKAFEEFPEELLQLDAEGTEDHGGNAG